MLFPLIWLPGRDEADDDAVCRFRLLALLEASKLGNKLFGWLLVDMAPCRARSVCRVRGEIAGERIDRMLFMTS